MNNKKRVVNRDLDNIISHSLAILRLWSSIANQIASNIFELRRISSNRHLIILVHSIQRWIWVSRIDLRSGNIFDITNDVGSPSDHTLLAFGLIERNILNRLPSWESLFRSTLTLFVLFFLHFILIKSAQDGDLASFTLLRYWLWGRLEQVNSSSFMFYISTKRLWTNRWNKNKRICCVYHLQEMKGILWSYYHQSSEISMVSRALASPWALWRWFWEWVINCWRYSPWKVFRILKKYSRSGILPLGIFEGKNRMNFSSFLIIGHSLTTDSSS